MYANLKVEYGRASSNLDLAYFGQCCIISSSQLIQCYTSIGTGNKHAWKVNIGSQDSSILHANTSYGNPVVRDYEKVTVPVDQLRTDGNDYVIVVGDNFGTTPADWVTSTTSLVLLGIAPLTRRTSIFVPVEN